MNDTAPPIRRSPMTPGPWFGVGNALRSALTGRGGERPWRPAPLPDDAAPWMKAARRRRGALLAAVSGSSAAALALLVASDPQALHDPLAWLHIALCGLLFAWVAAGFFTAAMGFATLLRGDRHALSAPRGPIDAAARTAVVMPICNEDIVTVFGGLRSICASLAATGASRLFDIYVLSDTSDAALRAAELRAWRALRDSLGDERGRVFYRWRRRRTQRKAGNVTDFCRRWGANYRYMVVLDADSVMSGDSLVSLVRLMEAHPRAGIVQSLPRACGHDTLHARAQQFLGRVAGRLFAAGLAYWQLGESHYWGHNAIVRLQPFMRHCALSRLPGRGGLSGDILSHDFVEAALMRRAGHEVWMVDLDGSYEQAPPHLIDELRRDRRWCQGNLQNARLIAEPGFAPAHRTMLATGAMAYLASPLWLAFVVLGISRWATGHDAVVAPSLAPVVGAAVLAMLLLPRLLGVIWVLVRREQASFGGTGRLVCAALIEAGLASLQAPVRMVSHTLFVLSALTGLRLDWKSPSRDAVKVGWGDAARRFGAVGVLAAVGLAIGVAVGPTPTWTLLSLAVPLVLAVPLAVFTSRIAPGAWLRGRRLLLIPEEASPPRLLRRVWPRPAWRPPARQLRTGPRGVPALLGRALAVAVLALVPLASSPTADDVQVAFLYLAVFPPRYEAPAAPPPPAGDRRKTGKPKVAVVKRLRPSI